MYNRCRERKEQVRRDAKFDSSTDPRWSVQGRDLDVRPDDVERQHVPVPNAVPKPDRYAIFL